VVLGLLPIAAIILVVYFIYKCCGPQIKTALFSRASTPASATPADAAAKTDALTRPANQATQARYTGRDAARDDIELQHLIDEL